MKLSQHSFLADENIHPNVTAYLRERGCDVATAAEISTPGAQDHQLLALAHDSGRIVLTHDSDFGRLAIADGQPFVGIIYLRPGHIRAEFTIRSLAHLFESDPDLRAPFLLVAVQRSSRIKIRIRSME